ncbi:MAG: B12-binding domain-containing radical SAM protein [Theionarchaea archaeon]|nr:B12-binding domain-containing radical SAM protein [Theionarchaea archaeon]
MKITLITPSPLSDGEWNIPYLDLRGLYPSLGVPILRELIKDRHDVQMMFYDHIVNDDDQIVREAAKSDITGFSLISFFQYPATRKIIRRLHQEEVDTTIVLGGLFSTYHARYICEDGVDVIMNGEGEVAFPQFLRTIENEKPLESVSGITFRREDAVIDTGRAPLADLDTVPFPSYDDLPLEEAGYKYIPCETSRGCYNNCSFCGIFPHGNWRAYSPERAIQSMKHAYEYVRYAQAPHIFLTDSNFFVDAQRIKQMADLMEDEVPSYCPTRVDHVNRETVKYLKKIGIKEAFVGVESASESTLITIRKRLDHMVLEKKFEILLENGIVPRLSFIIGLPGEDTESVISTVKYIVRVIEQFKDNINVVLFPCRQDLATSASEFKWYTSLETASNALMSDHDNALRKWMLALVYLVNTYHNTLHPDEQIQKIHQLIKSSPRETITQAIQYDGKQRPWLGGFSRYFQSLSEG